MKASLISVKVGERLSWSKNNSDRKTMVSTSQYLGMEKWRHCDIVTGDVMRTPEQGATGVRSGAHRAGQLESLVSWDYQAQ